MFLQLEQQSLLIGKRPAGFTEHYYTKWDDGLGKEQISLFMVISIGSSQVPGPEVGREAFQLLQDHFLDDLDGDPYNRFESALREINLMITEKEKEMDIKFIPNVHVVVGVIQKDQLYLSQRGDAQGYLVRKRHVSSITDDLYDPKNKDDLFQNIASGVLEVGDSVVLVTGQLVQYVTPTDFSKIFSEQSLGEAAVEIKELLHGDLEEQIALLSFEVLEKTQDLVHTPIHNDEGPHVAPKETQSEHNERVKKSLKNIREWLDYKDRFAFLSRMKQLNQKSLLTLIVSILVVIVAGLILLNITSGKKKQIAAMEANLTVAEENVTQAATQGIVNKDEANVLLDEAEQLAITVLDSGYLGSQVSTLLDDIAEQRDFLDNVIRIGEELTLLVDFSGILGRGSVQGVVPYDDKHVVYTETEIYEVLIDETQTPIEIDTDDQVISAAYFADQDNVVLLMDDENLVEFENGNVQFADTSDVIWEQGVDVSTYSNKLYVLDSADGQIWRYQRGTSGYGSGQAYVDTEEVDLTSAVSFAIDGNIWVLNEDGSITKLLSGDVVPFTVRDEPLTSLAGATKIFTELESTNIYVLDPTENRMLTYTKHSTSDDISYVSQYVFPELRGDLKDFYVDKSRNVFLIVTDEALYELSFED